MARASANALAFFFALAMAPNGGIAKQLVAKGEGEGEKVATMDE
jgi:hypothetical protein